jgi:hypothetical protein
MEPCFFTHELKTVPIVRAIAIIKQGLKKTNVVAMQKFIVFFIDD